MKKLMLLLIMVILSFSFSFPVTASDINTDGLSVSLVNQDPDPVEPGEYVDVRIQLENDGSAALEDVSVGFEPYYPFTLDPGSNAVREVGTLSPYQSNDQAVIVKFKTRVDDNAVEGVNPFRVKVKTKRSNWATYEFDINVRTIDATLSVESVKVEPSAVEPGKEAKVAIKVQNLADSLLKDISMNLDLTLQTLTGTADLSALPFAPTSSGTEKKITQLGKNAESIFTYNLIVYPTAESGVYKIPLQLKFYDELGTEYTKNDVIGIVVNSEPDISVVLDSTEISKAEAKGEVSVRFVNKGLNDIKFLNVYLDEDEDYDILEASEVYLGNIDSDDYETADLQIYVKGTDKSEITLPVTYEYMDANNNKYKKSADIEIRLLNEDEAKKLGVEESSGNRTIFIVIAVLVIGFIAYRIVRKKRKN